MSTVSQRFLVVALLVVLVGACGELPTGPEIDSKAVAGLHGRIVFQAVVLRDTVSSARHEIFLLDLDAATVTQLTDTPGTKSTPAISPSGDRITFGWDTDGGQDIYLMDMDGSNVTRLTSGELAARSPSWSPAGDRIAFAFGLGRGLALINADGSGREELAIRSVGGPSWSPDGARLAFWHVVAGDFEIFSSGLHGEDLRQLTNHPGGDEGPSWSPDGQRIVFNRDEDNDGQDVFVMNKDGSGVERLTDFPRDQQAFSPVWSPEGDKIVFPGHDGLYVINADGTGQRRILREDTASSPDWR